MTGTPDSSRARDDSTRSIEPRTPSRGAFGTPKAELDSAPAYVLPAVIVAGPPSAAGVSVTLTLPLPGIDDSSWGVDLLVIHEADRLTEGIDPRSFPMSCADGMWSTSVTIAPEPHTSFGLSGRYLYRFSLTGRSGSVVVPWFTDPFARATDDVGQLSAFDTKDAVAAFEWTDDVWKVPDLNDLVIYELDVGEFGGTFSGVAGRIPYLQSLGVNCVELMPVTSLKLDFDWGYGPLHYFAPNERWGGGPGLKALVDACHCAGVAVVLDVVFQHVDPTFPYSLVYAAAGVKSPMINGAGNFGPEVDYTQPFSTDYVHAVTAWWLNEYHVDGFRYDEVTDMYNEPIGDPYAGFAYDVYNQSLALARFTPSGGTAPGEYSRVIQIPEATNRPQEVLANTYTPATWQDNLLYKAEDMATNGCYVDDHFALLLDASFSGYPTTKSVHDTNGNPVAMPVAPVQYINNHDHSHLLGFVTSAGRDPDEPLADRTPWYKMQPFVVALYTAQGVPMLWQGQEVSDCWVLPPSGDLRIHFLRNMHWEYFYDPQGSPLVRLHRVLGQLRAATPALRSRTSYYYSEQSDPADGVIAYSRSTTDYTGNALVVLNFSDIDRTLSVPTPAAGTYSERVDAGFRSLSVTSLAAGDPVSVTVPSNYGYVLTSGI